MHGAQLCNDRQGTELFASNFLFICALAFFHAYCAEILSKTCKPQNGKLLPYFLIKPVKLSYLLENAADN